MERQWGHRVRRRYGVSVLRGWVDRVCESGLNESGGHDDVALVSVPGVTESVGWGGGDCQGGGRVG